MDQPRSAKLPVACSFKPMLHPHYEVIKQECDPWIVGLLHTTSAAATQYCIDCMFPLFSCLVYPECASDRVVHLAKFLAWYFLSDTDDDHPSLLGSEECMIVSARRHQLLIALHAGQLPAIQNIVADDPRTIKGLQALQEVWQHIAKDMPTAMQSRFLDSMRDYLNAVRIQAHYRATRHLPENVEEYIILRRPASLVIPTLILMEYGLGIQLDDEAVHSELMLQLHNAVIDHLALVNDIISFEVEIFCEDYINLPSILRKHGGAGMTLSDAVQESLRIIEELDRLCVRLMAEVEQTSLIDKPGMRAYLRGLEFLLGGNLEWSLRTVRYTHVCSPATKQQDEVTAVESIWA